LKKLFVPKSVAVIGVSREPQKIGYIVFDNLLSSFNGKVYGINPNAQIILGEPIYKSVHDVKGPVEMAVVCVPAPLVIPTLEACGKKGVSQAIIISSGFSEVGQKGKETELQLQRIARRFNMRLLGPNCLGVINNFNGLNASFATAKLPAKYRVGIFSQSGAFGAAMLDFANGGGFGFSYFVSLGNKLDISEIDLIEAWVDDPNVAVAVGYLEDIRDGEAFLKVAKRFTAQKPLIILKGGTTAQGGKAARLHTAAMTQDDEVFRAAMREAGVILASNINDLFELAIAFSENNLPKGRNLVVVSNAGGPSVVTADACSTENVMLPSLSATTVHLLGSQTEAASLENPIDLRGDASKDDYGLAIDLAMKDPKTDGLLVITTPQNMTELQEIAWKIVEAKMKYSKPIYANFLGGDLVSGAISICRESGVPTFAYPERAVRAFSFQANYKQIRVREIKELKKHPKHAAAKSVLRFHGQQMNYGALISLLSIYGIPMANVKKIKTLAEVGPAFGEMKGPVVLKIASPEILHKTDVGGVILGIKNIAEAEKAYGTILKNVKKSRPKAKIEGVIMMEMAKEGLELIVGAKRDAVFGPVLMFGFGGILVELISDYSLAIAPFDREKIGEMIESTKVSRIIKGYRSGKKYNAKKIEDIVLAVGQLMTEHSEINSIEINPLVMSDDGVGAIGLDAKIDIRENTKEVN
jgi:acetyltransferase